LALFFLFDTFFNVIIFDGFFGGKPFVKGTEIEIQDDEEWSYYQANEIQSACDFIQKMPVLKQKIKKNEVDLDWKICNSYNEENIRPSNRFHKLKHREQTPSEIIEIREPIV